MTHDELLRAYRRLRLLREFEERTRLEFQTGQIAGFTHLYAGSHAHGPHALGQWSAPQRSAAAARVADLRRGHAARRLPDRPDRQG